MKILSVILVFYIGVLVFQPLARVIGDMLAIQTENTCGDNCCCEHEQLPVKQEQHNKQLPHDCCPNGICNPFLQCACCSMVSGTLPNLQPAVILRNIVLVLSPRNIESAYSSRCFHPPEFA